MKSTPSFLLATAIIVASGACWAHGDAHHPRPAGPVAAEQQPWGIAGVAARARRTIEVDMSDTMRFTPDHIDVRQGETVRFVVRNRGRMLHEMVIGTRAALEEHAALMVKFPDMEHDEPFMTHVKPGAREELVWNFNRPGQFHYACLIPGHYQAGMVGTIRVAPQRQPTQRKEP